MEEDSQTLFSIHRINEKNGDNFFFFNLSQKVRKNRPLAVADRRPRAMDGIHGLASDHPGNNVFEISVLTAKTPFFIK